MATGQSERDDPVFQAVLNYAQSGVAVFPCSPKNKRPFTDNGFYDATCDIATVVGWWRKWPKAMIGMPTGARTGCFVLDVDMKNGKNGEASLVALIAKMGPLPATRTARTGTGGRHLYFNHPGGDTRIACSTSALGDGLDVKGDGGYVILPPSVCEDGTFYSWITP